MPGAAIRHNTLRMQGYDYALQGCYFVTIVAQHHLCLFGRVADGQMSLNGAGQMLAKWWQEICNKFTVVQTDEFAVMPNHFHGILLITDPVGADLRVRPGTPDPVPCPSNDAAGSVRPNLSKVIQWFKTMTTNAYIRGVRLDAWTPFHGQLWQRNYYDHIIRSAEDLDNARQYIMNNPLKWELDRENPKSDEK